MAAGLISTVVVLVGGPRTAIRLPLAIFLGGIVVVAASTWLVLADLSRPWSGNGEPPCPAQASSTKIGPIDTELGTWGGFRTPTTGYLL